MFDWDRPAPSAALIWESFVSRRYLRKPRRSAYGYAGAA